LAITLHRVGGQRNDRNVPARQSLPRTNDPSCLKAVHVRHANIHENDVEIIARQFVESRVPALRHLDLVPLSLERRDCQFLIRETVFRDEHAKGGELNDWIGRAPRTRSGGAPQRQGDGAKHLRLLCGLHQMGHDTQLPAPRRIARPVPRTEHHERRLGEFGIALNVFGQRESTHARHVGVDDRHRHRIARTRRDPQDFERRLAVSGLHGLHLPGADHLTENSPIDPVIVDDEHGKSMQVFRSDALRHGLLAYFEPGGEMERRTAPNFTFHPDTTCHQLGESPADGESQTGAAIPACRTAVELFKGLKDVALFVRWNADAAPDFAYTLGRITSSCQNRFNSWTRARKSRSRTGLVM
jgi:hypothetical protein